MIAQPFMRRGEEPLPLSRITEGVRLQPVDAMVRARVQLVARVIVEEPLDGAVVPELRRRARHQVHAVDLQRSVGLEPHAVELAGVAVGVAPVARPFPMTEVADEHLALRPARDRADPRRDRGAEDGTRPIAAHEIPVAVADGITG